MRHTKNINVRQYQADWFGSKNGLNNTPLLRSITRKKSIKKVSDFLLYPRIKRGFSTRGSTCAAIAFYISPPPFSLSSRFFLFPFSLTFFPPEPPPPPLEDVTAAILSYAASHLQGGIRTLRKTCADTVGHFTESVPSLQSLKKWPPAQSFDMQAADRRSPIQVLTQRQAAWLEWLPGAGHLPRTYHARERCWYTDSVQCEIKY